MRINFVGNTCNNHFVLASYLRRRGIDAHLYFDCRDHLQALPQSEDPSLTQALPDWLHPIAVSGRHWRPAFQVPTDLVRELANCDLLHVHGVPLMWMPQTSRPYIWHPYGGDLYHLPFAHGWMKRVRGGLLVPDPRNLLTPRCMRRAMAGAEAIVLGWHHRLWLPGLRLIHRLGLKERIVRHHLAINTDLFTVADGEHRARLRRKLLGHRSVDKFIIFHPTRQAFASPHGDTQNGNDRLYRALAQLQAEGHDFLLILVEKGNEDEPAARRLIHQLGLESRVLWRAMMPRHALIPWYQLADLTADHFVGGAIGSTPLESMACGTPTMTFIQLESEDDLFLDPREMFSELPPVINVRTEDEIAAALHHVLVDRNRLHELRRRSRQWVESHAAGDVVARRYEQLYHDVLGRRAARPCLAAA